MKLLNICNAIMISFLCATEVANAMNVINFSAESKQVLEEMSTFIDYVAAIEPLTVQQRREVQNNLFVELSGLMEVDVLDAEDFCVGPSYSIPVIFYPVCINEQAGNNEDVILFVHGGGWAQGNLDTHEYLCQKIIKKLERNVLVVDYRLAPEHPFPEPLEDVVEAYKWCAKRYTNVHICGDSAGGNLCAALCIKVAQEKIKKPASAILLYPSLSNDFTKESYKLFGNVKALTTTSCANYLSQYAGQNASDIKNSLICPLQQDDMSVFPKVIMVSAECDILLDEAKAFVAKCKENNIPCHHIIVDGAVHGFMTYGSAFDNVVTNVLEQVKNFIK